MKFAHIGFAVKVLARSKDFYKQIFEALGLPLIDESEQSARAQCSTFTRAKRPQALFM